MSGVIPGDAVAHVADAIVHDAAGGDVSLRELFAVHAWVDPECGEVGERLRREPVRRILLLTATCRSLTLCSFVSSGTLQRTAGRRATPTQLKRDR